MAITTATFTIVFLVAESVRVFVLAVFVYSTFCGVALPWMKSGSRIIPAFASLFGNQKDENVCNPNENT